MILSTNVTDFSAAELGMVEYAASMANDRLHKACSKAEWIAYINQAQFAIGNRINRLYENYFVRSATTATVAGQSVYQLPTDAVKVLGLEVGDSASDRDPQPFTNIVIPDRRLFGALSEASSKRGFGAFFIAGTEMTIYPADSGSGRTMRMYYVKRLSRLVDDADVSEIPEEYHELLPIGAVRREASKRNRRNIVADDLWMELIGILEQSIANLAMLEEESVAPWLPEPNVTPYPVD